MTTFNGQEQEIASQYTSELYGIVWGADHIDTLAFLSQMSKFYEDYLPKVHQSELVSVFVFIGHWNLLLNHFPKAISAYNVAIRQNPALSTDPLFLFGVGIAYFYYGIYDRSSEALQRLCWVSPTFPRIADALIRLALTFKHYGSYDISEKYYKMINREQPGHSMFCSLSRAEVLFSWGHLYQLKEDHQLARQTYEFLIKNRPGAQSLSPALQLRLMKQITCLLHNLPNTQTQQFLDACSDFIMELMNCIPESPMIFYYVGRCLAVANRVNEAFFKYRSCVDRMQNGADVWCSIGNLYQQQNQLTDALQAYVCSLQIRTDHFESWYNVGVLYEGVNQIRDAISAYVHASNQCQDKELNKRLVRRIELLRSYQAAIIESRPSLAGIGPSGLPGSVSATNLRSFGQPETVRETHYPFDYQTIQNTRALVEQRCSQISSLGHLSVVHVDAILPYARQPIVQTRQLRVAEPEPTDASPSSIIQRHTELNERNLLLLGRSIMWTQFSQIYRLRLYCASTGQLAALMPSHPCVVNTHPFGGQHSYRLRISHTTTNVLQFARYQASSCIQQTSCDVTPQQVSYAYVCPVCPQLSQVLYQSLPPSICPDRANNLLSYCPPSGKPGIYLLVPGARLPARQNPYATLYLNVGPGEVHWQIVDDYRAAENLNMMFRRCTGVDCSDGTEDLWPHGELCASASTVVQKSGDLLIVKANAMHWSTSLGWTNCVRWGIASFSSFKRLLYDYEKGMLRLRSRPNVPVERLALTLARECYLTSAELYELVLQVISDRQEGKCLLCEGYLWLLDRSNGVETDSLCERCRILYYPTIELPLWSERDELLQRFKLYIPILRFSD